MKVSRIPALAFILLGLLAACSAGDAGGDASTPVLSEPTQDSSAATPSVTCETGDPPKDGLRALPGRAGEDICVVWQDNYTDETGFEVILEYPSEGARMTYPLPPNTEVFVFPAKDQPRAVPSPEACRRRTFHSVQVVVYRPDGAESVGGFAAQGHCGQD